MDNKPAPINHDADKQMLLAAQFQAAGNTESAIQSYREALKIDPNNTDALNNLAWILSSADDPEFRNGQEAVELAMKAAKLTEGRQPIIIGTLAAAFAETGQFSKASATALIAHDLAQLTGRIDIAAKNAELLALYASGKAVNAPDIQ